jgi:hypothetical protein
MWAVIAFAMIVSWRLGKGLEAAHSRITELSGDIAATRENSDRLRARLAKAESLRANPRADFARTAASDRGKHGEGHNWLEQLSSDPQLQNRFLAYQRSKLATKYGSLFQQLGLTPEQISKCEDNLVMRQGIYMDLADALRAQGLPQNGPAAQQIYNQLMAGYDSAQKELLGEDGFNQLNSYDQDFHWKTMANDFAGSATLAGIALSQSQVQQLSDAAIQASKTPGAGKLADLENTFWTGVDTQAASFLTPAQLDLMKSGEFIGPSGEGSRFQSRLNDLITLGDQADAQAAHPEAAQIH